MSSAKASKSDGRVLCEDAAAARPQARCCQSERLANGSRVQGPRGEVIPCFDLVLVFVCSLVKYAFFVSLIL